MQLRIRTACSSRVVAKTNWAYFFNAFNDDVGFFRQLINTLQASVGPDSKRIYVTGLPSGALMSHRLGVQLSDLVAATGVLEGALFLKWNPPQVPFCGRAGFCSDPSRRSGQNRPVLRHSSRRVPGAVVQLLEWKFGGHLFKVRHTSCLVRWSGKHHRGGSEGCYELQWEY